MRAAVVRHDPSRRVPVPSFLHWLKEGFILVTWNFYQPAYVSLYEGCIRCSKMSFHK
jgi:hypothetical protein